MRFVRYSFIALFLVLGWLIGWTNNTPVEFSFLIWSFPELPVFVYYLMFLIVGTILGLLLGRLVSRG